MREGFSKESRKAERRKEQMNEQRKEQRKKRRKRKCRKTGKDPTEANNTMPYLEN